MLNKQSWCGWDRASITIATIVPITLGMALLNVKTAPASAQSVFERGMTSSPNRVPLQSGVVVEQGFYPNVRQPSNAAPFVYGSPIATPVPVNPATGVIPSNTNIYSYPNSYSYPVRTRVDNSTLVNPVLVNPRIRDSTVVNPVIVNDPVYQAPVRYRRSPNFYYSY
jgi:hypothetical protein